MTPEQPAQRTQPATAKQVRDYYLGEGYEVRISNDGRVEFRDTLYGSKWKDGCWVCMYVAEPDGDVRLK